MNSMLSPFLVINIIPAIPLMHPIISFSYLYTSIPPRLGVSVNQILTPLTTDCLSCFVDTDLLVGILF